MAKAQTVTKSDLVDAIAADTGMSKTAAKSALESVIDNISSSLKKVTKFRLLALVALKCVSVKHVRVLSLVRARKSRFLQPKFLRLKLALVLRTLLSKVLVLEKAPHCGAFFVV